MATKSVTSKDGAKLKGKLKFRIVVLKISGEGLAGKDGCFDGDVIRKLARRVKRLRELGVLMIIVVGGGNILRGAQMKSLNPKDRKETTEQGHLAGMLATCINAILVADSIRAEGVSVYLTSARRTFGIKNVFSVKAVRAALARGEVVVHGGGIGKTGFSTDTATLKLAKSAGAEMVAMAKNGTDGIYSDDPNKNPKATFFPEISASEFIRLGLKQVIDMVAVRFAKRYRITIAVFNSNNDTAVEEIAQGKRVGSLVLPE